jgi:uncharacterized delta-60 repeat protein
LVGVDYSSRRGRFLFPWVDLEKTATAICIVLSGWLCRAGDPTNAFHPGQLDETFVPPAISAPVASAAVQADGKVLIGGGFTNVDGIARAGVARLNADGSPDTAFNQGPGVNAGATVRALTVLADGKILIAGDFTNYNGTVCVPLARLNSDGSLDSSFTPDPRLSTAYPGFATKVNVDYTTPTLRGGTRQVLGVNALAVTAEGKIYIAGSFYGQVGSQGLLGIARLNSDGGWDDTFLTAGDDYATYHPSLNFVVSLSGGGVLVAGDRNYPTDGGIWAVAKLLANGKRDSNWRYYLDWAHINGALSLPVTQAFTGTPDGLFIIASRYAKTLPGSSLYETNLLSFGRAVAPENYDPTGGWVDQMDESYSAPPNLDARFLQAQPDGKVIVYGNLSASAGFGQKSLARLLPGGQVDTNFDAGTGPDGAVLAMARQADGKWIVAGAFTNYNGTRRPYVARIFGDDPSGTEPKILVQPADLLAPEANQAKLSLTARGPGLTFQWRKNGVNVPGATNDSLAWNQFPASDAGIYDAVVSNRFGAVFSSTATVSVLTITNAAGATNAGWQFMYPPFPEILDPEHSGWQAELEISHDGNGAAKASLPAGTSMNFPARYTTSWTALLNGPGTVSYWVYITSPTNQAIPPLQWQRRTVRTLPGPQRFALSFDADSLSAEDIYLDELTYTPDPNPPQGVPVRLGLKATPIELTLSFSTVAGRTYVEMTSLDLNHWYPLVSFTASRNESITLTGPSDWRVTTSQFFRVLEYQP